MIVQFYQTKMTQLEDGNQSTRKPMNYKIQKAFMPKSIKYVQFSSSEAICEMTFSYLALVFP